LRKNNSKGGGPQGHSKKKGGKEPRVIGEPLNVELFLEVGNFIRKKKENRSGRPKTPKKPRRAKIKRRASGPNQNGEGERRLEPRRGGLGEGPGSRDRAATRTQSRIADFLRGKPKIRNRKKDEIARRGNQKTGWGPASPYLRGGQKDVGRRGRKKKREERRSTTRV